MPCKLSIAFCYLLIVLSCRKTQTNNSTVVIDLAITGTSTQASQTQQSGITSQIRCIQRNTCEKFYSLEVKGAGTRGFEIRAKGTYPIAKDAFACGQIVTYKDTTVTIPAATKGQYLLYFYNQDQLFKTDTVQVN